MSGTMSDLADAAACISTFRTMAAPDELERMERKACRARFPVGTVVKLRGQEQPLTVDQWRNDDLVVLLWFSGSELNRESFDPLTLVSA